jgi:DNA modification methylase
MNKKLEWKTKKRNVHDLVPQDYNPRIISPEQMKKLKDSFERFNLVEIPVIDIDNSIIAGHQRIDALIQLGRGDEEIEVRVPNRKLTDDEQRRYNIISNKVGGEWNFEKLKDFDFELLKDSGFDELELNDFWDKDVSSENDEFNEEKEIEQIRKNPQVRLGDMIHLGKHKILCGDSTNPDNLKRLLGDEQASMIYSDPIYNINIDYNGGVGGKQDYGGEVNDTRNEQEYYEFITKAVTASLAVSKPDTHVFYWCDQIYIGYIQDIYRKHEIQNKRVALWVKNNQNPVPSVAFNKVYEPCVYGVRGKPYLNDTFLSNNEVLNKDLGTGNDLLDQINDLWTVKRLPAGEYEHATSKPITLHEKAILRCTKVNDIIIDSFLGSGSTLLCAEQLQRRVYGCELEPEFCELIARRYEKLTGTKAIIEHEKEHS